MRRYLVTGGAGFIGSNLVEALVEQDADVRVLDNLSTGRLDNLQPFLADIEFIQGDLRDLDTVRRAVEGVDVVLHQAALPSVPASVADPLTFNAVNIDGTLNLLLAARDAGVSRLVFASSCAIYGDSPALPKVETMLPKPLSPYAVAKLTGEHYCRIFSELYGLPTVALRYFNVFGPRQEPGSSYAAVIPMFVSAMLRGEPPLINGDGQQSRDFVYVDDVVAANLRAAEVPPSLSSTYNLAGGERISLLRLVAELNQVLGSQIEPRHGPPRAGDILHSHADISKIRQELGFTPAVPFAEGLARTVAALADQGSRSRVVGQAPALQRQ